jgi:hypothetical protein
MIRGEADFSFLFRQGITTGRKAADERPVSLLAGCVNNQSTIKAEFWGSGRRGALVRARGDEQINLLSPSWSGDLPARYS